MIAAGLSRLQNPPSPSRPGRGNSLLGTATPLLALLAAWLAAGGALPAQGQPREPVLSVAKPRYVLQLTLSEYSLLNAAEVDGLLKYGGSGEFKLRMAKEGNEVLWTVTIDNPRLMELLGIFIGEKTVKVVQNLDPNRIDPSEKVAFQAIKSLSQKLDFAQKNPLWDSVTLAGTVLPEGTNWVLQTRDGKLRLTGERVPELKLKAGRPIVAEGYVKVPGQFELLRHRDQRVNTLELFVMSMCPFGQKAETTLYQFLGQARTSPPPVLEIHYLFYKAQQDGKDVFSSLHGEEELTEDLVQIVLRDSYPAAFAPYLLLRAESGRTSWKKLVEQVGLKTVDVAAIEQLISTQRGQLIQREYDHAVQYGITDGSPSYVWESERVFDLRKLEPFKGLAGTADDTCAK